MLAQVGLPLTRKEELLTLRKQLAPGKRFLWPFALVTPAPLGEFLKALFRRPTRHLRTPRHPKEFETDVKT